MARLHCCHLKVPVLYELLRLPSTNTIASVLLALYPVSNTIFTSSCYFEDLPELAKPCLGCFKEIAKSKDAVYRLPLDFE